MICPWKIHTMVGMYQWCVQDCVGERKRWSLWGTLEIHEHAHACIVGPLCARHYDLVYPRARRDRGCGRPDPPVLQIYRYADSSMGTGATQCPQAW